MRRLMQIGGGLMLALAALVLPVQADEKADGNTFVSSWDDQGVPDNLADPVPVSSEILQSINEVLVERADVRIHHPEFVASDDQAELRLLQDANVSVTFVHEGAGFRNAMGCFLYEAGDRPTTPDDVGLELLFPNTSFVGSGGGLQVGDTVSLGLQPAGTAIGFWLRANAWQAGSATVSEIGWQFHTLSDLNAEPTAELRAHTVLLWEAADQQLVLGIEDFLRTEASCDHDFNDVVFLVNVDPPEAIDLAEIIEVPEAGDQDDDGVPDLNDAYPDDPERASVTYVPSVNGREILVCEDQWPYQGDYDFNDLVAAYRFREVLDAQGRLKETTVLVEPRARGAAQHNGLAMSLPWPGGAVSVLEVLLNDEPVVSGDRVIDGGDACIITLIDNFHDALPTSGDHYANTQPGTPLVPGDRIEVRLEFATAVSRADIGEPPYDLFVYRTHSPGYEIHTVDTPPTFRAQAELIGTGDDRGNPELEAYYRDTLGFPWLLILPEGWQHPLEHVQLSFAYPMFAAWVESGGGSDPDWYLWPESSLVWSDAVVP